MDISLSKLPWYGQIGAFVLLGLSGAGAFHSYYEVPMNSDIAAREFRLTSLRNDAAKGVVAARKLPAFRAQVADLEARLDGLKAVLPDEQDVADLLRRMQIEAARSNLDIKGFKPGPAVTRPLHAEWPIALELEGTYHDLAIFFDRLGKFTRIVNISGLDVRGKEKPDGRATITATCVATTFALLDKPAPPKTGQKGA